VRDLLGRLSGPLENPAGLLANAVKRVPDRGLGRTAYFQLSYETVDSLDIAVDLPALVAADGGGE
jgi:hypothetical protein